MATSYGIMQRRLLPDYHGSQRKRIVLQYYFYGSIPYAKHKNNWLWKNQQQAVWGLRNFSRQIGGGWMRNAVILDCYNQRLFYDVFPTVTTRIDHCNHYWVTQLVYEKVDTTTSNEWWLLQNDTFHLRQIRGGVMRSQMTAEPLLLSWR